MPDIFLYRKNGNQVKNAGTVAGSFDNWDPTYYDTITDPTLPDGKDTVPVKIRDGTTVRNATAPEIAIMATAEATDNKLIARTAAKERFDNDPIAKKYLKAIVQVTLDEINILRAIESLPARTLAQAKSAIESKIDAGDFD